MVLLIGVAPWFFWSALRRAAGGQVAISKVAPSRLLIDSRRRKRRVGRSLYQMLPQVVACIGECVVIRVESAVDGISKAVVLLQF